uniref:Remorin C-terminal domain-containing protein n=1 Tax=Leersia perrieri TaxID=77586 RepID=A0A0D9XR76_9ORYZ
MQATRAVDDKECYYGHNIHGEANNVRPQQQRKNNPASRGPKPTPSKWDDAQKWLVSLSSNGGMDGIHGKVRPRNSNADDRRLLSSSSQNGRVSCSSVDGALEYTMVAAASASSAPPTPPQLGEAAFVVVETKKMDCCMVQPQQHGSPVEVLRSVCLRDMGTEMTPIASKEPSRSATPLRASTPVSGRSPMSSPGRRRRHHDGPPLVAEATTVDLVPAAGGCSVEDDCSGGFGRHEPGASTTTALECRAAAWDEAERAKFTARYKREEMKIQAWENHEKRKAELEMKKTEMKAEQMKARAQERLANKLAAARRMAEEKRASAEAKLNEHAARTTQRADYIRRTGHLPSFSFKMPSLCG